MTYKTTIQQKQTRIFFVVITLILIPLLFFYSRSLNKSVEERYRLFYNTNIDGKLSYVSASAGLMYIKLENSDVKYGIKPISSDLNNNEQFINIAKVGDRLIKPAKTDTMTLITTTGTYRYTFYKLVDNP